MKKIVCGFILLSLLLAGCVPIIATNFKLKLSPDEKWNLTTEIVLTASDAMLFGETITGFINEMNQDTEFAGLDATWETTGPDRDDNVSYIITINGQGFELLNDHIPGSIATYEEGSQKYIDFYWEMGSAIEWVSLSSSFTLSGGKIISTNGTRVNSNTIRWDNMDKLEAIMEYPESPVLLPYLLGLGLAGFLILGIVLIVKGKQGKTFDEDAGQPDFSSPDDPFTHSPRKLTKKFCTVCGARLKSKSGICSQCGNPN